jgi:hypothetical protein
MPSVIRENIWKLRTDPFYPDIDTTGKPIPTEALDKSLNPLVDDRVVPFYFDVYDWSASDLVRGLSEQEALSTFPTPRTLPGTSGLLVLISGDQETGLDSLANLVIHKIKLTSQGKEPIVIDVELEGRDKVRNVAAVARRIIDRVDVGQPAIPDGPALAARMQTKYDRVHAEEASRKDATYAELFRAFKDILAPVGRPLVIQVTSGGDNDSWVRIHESTRSCCSYVIVMTPDLVFAQTCYTAMIGSKLNVAWIQAKPLDQAKARQFVERRLALQRVTALDPKRALFPFTSDAIAALYEPGAAGPPKAVTHPVGWLRRTLYTALSEHLLTVDDAYAKAAPAVQAAFDPDKTFLGPEQLKRARDKLAKGLSS